MVLFRERILGGGGLATDEDIDNVDKRKVPPVARRW